MGWDHPGQGRCFLAGLFSDLSRHSLEESRGSRKEKEDKWMGRERGGEREGVGQWL